eukprot:g13164.t1
MSSGQQQRVGEEAPSTRTTRHLISSEDGKPMLSFPVERILRQNDVGGGVEGGGVGLWDSPHGHHHRLRSWQHQRQQEDEKRRRAQEEWWRLANQDNGPAAAASTRRRPTRPPATVATGQGAAAAAARARKGRRLDAAAAASTTNTTTTTTTAAAADAVDGTFDADITPWLPLRSSIGTHFVNAYVGTPPQSVRLIVDTGSYNTALPCVGCNKCRPGSAKPFWDPAASTTATQVACQDCGGSYKCSKFEPTCTYKQSYSEGSSWTATQMNDVFRLGADEYEEGVRGGVWGTGEEGWPSIDFGCIRRQTGMFNTQVPDGIIGLGPHQYSSIWAMTERESPQDRKFSLCFTREGGSMVLGGYDPELLLFPEQGHQFTPATFTEGFFEVEVVDVRLAGKSIVSPESLETFQQGTGTIVDSGTTDTYLPRSVADAFSEAWKSATGQEYEPCPGSTFCLDLTPLEAARLPILAFQFAGGSFLRIMPHQYLDSAVSGNPPKTHYAPRIYLTEWSGAVLGANIMTDRSIVFDLANERIGFADAQCDRGTVPPPPTAVEADEEGDGSKAQGGGANDQQEEEEGEDEGNYGGPENAEEEGVGDGFDGSGAEEANAHDQEGRGEVGGAISALRSEADEEDEEGGDEREQGQEGGTGSGGSGSGGSGGGGGGGGGGAISVEEGGDNLSGDRDMGGEGGRQKGDGSGGGGLGDRGPEMACLWRVWEPCRKECEHDLPEVHGCSGKRETRPCHTGSSCTSVSDGLYAELSFELDLGFRSEGGPAGPGGGGGNPDPDADPDAGALSAYHEDRWRLRVGDALAEAVAKVLPIPCGVLPGDVAVSVLPASPDVVVPRAPDGGGEEGEGVARGPRRLETAVVLVHFWRPEVKDDPAPEPKAEVGVALAMGGGGSVDQARCVSALAAPSVASDVAALAARELVVAAREPAARGSEGEAGDEEGEEEEEAREEMWSLGDMAALAQRILVVEAGRLAVRNAPSGHRVVDLASSSSSMHMHQRKTARGAAWLDPVRPGGGVLRNHGGGGGSGGGSGGFRPVDKEASFRNDQAPPSAGMSPVLALGMQAGAIVAVGLLLLLGQRLRASSPGSRDGAGVRRRKGTVGALNGPAGNAAERGRAFGGADEERGNGIGVNTGNGGFDKGKYLR